MKALLVNCKKKRKKKGTVITKTAVNFNTFYLIHFLPKRKWPLGASTLTSIVRHRMTLFVALSVSFTSAW